MEYSNEKVGRRKDEVKGYWNLTDKRSEIYREKFVYIIAFEKPCKLWMTPSRKGRSLQDTDSTTIQIGSNKEQFIIDYVISW